MSFRSGIEEMNNSEFLEWLKFTPDIPENEFAYVEQRVFNMRGQYSEDAIRTLNKRGTVNPRTVKKF